MRRMKPLLQSRRLTAVLLCLCLITSTVSGAGILGISYAASARSAGPTDNILERVADPNTMDSYRNMLLTDAEGSRYAGRIWTDKTVFAYGQDGVGDTVSLDKETDGYRGDVQFNSDFLHVFSALASSQLVNEYPPSPIDLVIAIDMSASMAQDTRYDIESITIDKGDYYNTVDKSHRTMEERIANSRIQKTLDAVNATIDDLMDQNRNNRVSVVVYGAGAEVVLPLAHYEKKDDQPYLKVGGMETLYRLGDLEYDKDYGWTWTRNMDAAYTIEADAMQNTENEPGFEFTKEYKNSVSNNVKNEEYVKALPGYEKQTEALLKSDAGSTEQKELSAEHYVGYFTNTQGGIFLAYEQLAKTKEVTYSEKLSTGVEATVARIPAAMIMTDGGANFAFNEMTWWDTYYGDYTLEPDTGYKYYEGQEQPYFRTDDSTYNPTLGMPDWDTARDVIDSTHRLNAPEQVGDEWYNVYLPSQDGHEVTSLYNAGMVFKEGTLRTSPAWNHAGIFYSNDGTFGGDSAAFATQGMILQTTMTAAYMKTAVDKHYSKGWDEANATKGNQLGVSTYTVSVDSEHVPQWGRLRLYPSLDPGNYLFKEDKWEKSEFLPNGSEGIPLDPEVYKSAFTKALDSWEEWKGGSEISPRIDAGEVSVKMKRIDDEGGAGYTDERYNVKLTNDEVAANIVYNDGFYDVSTAELGGIFNNILSLITGKVFVPITGDNDAGVRDSITYQDPIGEYMEIKNQSVRTSTHASPSAANYDMSLLSFGKMHGLVRTGVYDYQWNDTRMKATNPGSQGKDPLPIGWYKGEADEPSQLNVNFVPAENGLPPGCGSLEAAWEAGWIMRLDYKTILQYVPIANAENVSTPGEMPEQIRNTTYTVYRFAGSETERNALQLNPIYETAENGGNVPQEALDSYMHACTYEPHWNADMPNAFPDHVDSYPDNDDSYSDYPGVYRMSDIRVWVEEYGDYRDSEGNITPNSSAYDASVYMNIPVAAVPTQLAEITLGKSGVLSYKSNINDPDRTDECTPIRLFYTVGLDDDLITEKSEDGSRRVNISALSEEYVKEHSDPSTGSIWFISNYYSNTPYEGYIDDVTRTRGDPTVSFSPGEDNRYYVFQKPLALYAHAYRVSGGKLTAVDRSDGEKWTTADNHKGGNGETTWEQYNGQQQTGMNWSGGLFMGVYQDETDFQTRLKAAKKENGVLTITDANDEKYEVVDDGVVFLAQDLMDRVQSDEKGNYTDDSVSFSSSDYFFITVEYYVPDTTTQGVDSEGHKVPNSYGGKAVKRVVSRIGSSFGSGFNSDKINNGDMLCWTDMNGDIDLQFEYFSRTDTGDNTRGEPTYEKLFADRAELETYLESQCGVSRTKTVPAPTVEDPNATTTALQQQVDYWMNVRNDQKVEIFINRIKEKASAEYDGNEKAAFAAAANWAVATRRGGIRTGDMANNRRPKSANPTSTAGNCYIPAVSENSGVGDEVLINNFLGNNGRLSVANNQLLATKLLEAPSGFSLTSAQEDEAFNYQIFVRGVTGEVGATLVHYNPFAKVWQKQLACIDVLTDNSSLILDTSSQRATFAFVDNGGSTTARQVVQSGEKYYYANDDGTPNLDDEFSGGEESLYYMYLPAKSSDGSTEMSRRLYQDPDYDDSAAGNYDSVKENNRLTIYCGKDTTKPEDDEVNHINYADASATRPAGTFAYWAQDAELIPVDEVKTAEASALGDGGGDGPVTFALTDVSGGRWDHGSADNANHKHLTNYTIVVSRPEDETSDSSVASPFKTRTQFMSRILSFGVNSNASDGGKPSGALEEGDLYDQIIPSGDRPDLFGSLSKSYIAAHTAEFTLKSGQGLLLTGLENRVAYRFTEQLSEKQLENGYGLKEVSHVQQRGSDSIYRPGTQEIPVYWYKGAKYGSSYPARYQNAETENGLTWAIDKNGSRTSDQYLHEEPFNHANAVLWEYYATLGADELGNHHHRADQGTETADFFNKSESTGLTHTVLPNPSCATCDEPVYDDAGELVSYIHYMYKEGKLVDEHYEGEASAFLRNMSRFLVSTTAHFGVNDESQTSAQSAPPVTGSTDYNGVYSVFGNTGYFEEQAHYVNTFEPGDITVTKKLDAEDGTQINDQDKASKFGFTLELKQKEDGAVALPETLQYTITGPGKDETLRGTLPTYREGGPNDADKNGVKAVGEGKWTFRLSADQTMKVNDLPVGTSFTYTVTEDAYDGYLTDSSPDDKGGDADEREVKGTVTPKSRGPVEVTFDNTKKKPEPAKASLDLTKQITDNSKTHTYPGLAAEDFSFLVKPAASNPKSDPLRKQSGWDDKTGTLTVKNQAPDGDNTTAKASIFGDDAQFTEAGVYTYTVREVIPSETLPGISYDPQVYNVKVTVAEDYDENDVYTGKLKASVKVTAADDSSSDLLFDNGYDPDKISLSLQARKLFTDQNGKVFPLEDGDFTFTLKGLGVEYTEPANEGGAPSGDAPEASPGIFDDPTLDEPSADPPQNTKPTDPTPAPPASDTPSDDTSDPTDPGSTSGDTAAPTPGDVTPTPGSTPDPTDPTAGDTDLRTTTHRMQPMQLTLLTSGTERTASGDGDVPTTRSVDLPMPDETSVQVLSDGYATFDAATYTRAGIYRYEITEKIEDRLGVVYDTRTCLATVTVTRDRATGALKASVTYEDQDTGEPFAAFENILETGTLTVHKFVQGTGGEKQRRFAFTVTVTDDEGAPLTYIDGDYGEMTFQEGVAKFTLRDGQHLTAEDLPAGAHYRVEEADYSKDGYATTYEGQTDQTGAGVIEKDRDASITVTNTRDRAPGALVVTKTVTGTGDKKKAFHFTVRFTPATDLQDATVTRNGKATDLHIVGGMLTFTLKDGEEVRVADLPDGTKYRITEDEADQDGYVTTCTNDHGTIVSEREQKAAFINDKPSPGKNPKHPSGGTPEQPSGLPPTGDSNRMELWTILLIFSLIGAAISGRSLLRGRKWGHSGAGRHAKH